MRSEKIKGFREEAHHVGGRQRGRGGLHQRGPKTFRRGRAITFLEMMNLKRATIKQQLEQPEFQSIQPILVGELKAVDMVINEFSQLFEIHESETMGTSDSLKDDEKSLNNDAEGDKVNENN